MKLGTPTNADVAIAMMSKLERKTYFDTYYLRQELSKLKLPQGFSIWMWSSYSVELQGPEGFSKSFSYKIKAGVP